MNKKEQLETYLIEKHLNASNSSRLYYELLRDLLPNVFSKIEELIDHSPQLQNKDISSEIVSAILALASSSIVLTFANLGVLPRDDFARRVGDILADRLNAGFKKGIKNEEL